MKRAYVLPVLLGIVACDSGAIGDGSTTGGGDSVTGSGGASASQSASATGGGATTGTGSATTSTGTGGSQPSLFNECRLHFGTTSGIAENNPAMTQQLDVFTPGWMGLSDTFDMQYVCDYTKPGGKLANQIPVIVAYLAAFYVKRHHDLKDCNAPGAMQDLCMVGAQYIKQDLSAILKTYQSYAQGFAACYGTSRPIIFEMEPDFFQYTISNQTQPWSEQEAGQIMTQLVNAIKTSLPNALFSMDISPWIGNNGADNGQEWYSHFDMTLFSFINTSGGGTDASSKYIRSSNKMTWAGVHAVTGKPILADTGYGVNGGSAGPDPAWDDPVNINNRMADGVISITQYNPAADWGTTIANVRKQLNQPNVCP